MQLPMCKKKNVTLIRICHTCVAFKHKKTDLSLETRTEISFEVIKFVKKNVNFLPLTNHVGNIKRLVIFDLSRFSAKFGRPISTLFLPFFDH